MRTICVEKYPNENYMFWLNIRMKTICLELISESKLYIVRMKTIDLRWCGRWFPNENYIWFHYFRMKTICLSEWKLHIWRFSHNLWGKSVWKSRWFPNQSYMFIHNVRMKAMYISTTSEWELYIFPQLPNADYIFHVWYRNMLYWKNERCVYVAAIFFIINDFRIKTTYLSFCLSIEFLNSSLLDVRANG